MRSQPLLGMAVGGNGAICDTACGISDSLCRFFVWTGTCSASYLYPANPGNLGPIWDPLTPCTNQVPNDHNIETYEACEDCCGVTNPSPLQEDNRKLCEGLCLWDHGNQG